MPGRQSTFEQRFEPLSQRLYGYAVALTRDRDGARDLLHDCVVRAASAEAPDDEAAFRAWLFKVMRNLWIDQGRARARRSAFEDDLALSEAAAMPAPVALETVAVNALAVRLAFDRLSAPHREILALIDIAGFTYDEAAAMVGVPRGTVMSRVSRARRALAALLDDERVVALPRPRAADPR